MNQYELTKLAGAVLCALLLIFGTKTLIDLRMAGHGDSHAANGYKLPVAKTAVAGSGGAAPAAPAGFAYAKVVEAMAKANADNGKDIFKKCGSCHTADKGGKALQGPNLWDIVGRAKGSVQGFGYSESLKAKGGEWSYENLALFVNNPKGLISGTKMVFAGLAAPEEVADLLAYLRTLADTPVPLPSK